MKLFYYDSVKREEIRGRGNYSVKNRSVNSVLMDYKAGVLLRTLVNHDKKWSRASVAAGR